MNELQGTPMTAARAREMFRRVLRDWAMDTMRLRSAGLDRPTARGLLLRSDGAARERADGAGAKIPRAGAQERAA